MTEADFFHTIDRTGQAEFKDRGSRFLALAFPVQSVAAFKTILEQVKKEHLKANHHCFAYRIGLTGDVFRVSDDGEPSGTAGRPILGQIDSRGVTDTAIIVVRYFGGTLLGVPGLINAYKSAAALVLQTTPVIQKPIEVNYSLQFDYTVMNDVMNIIKQSNCTVQAKDMNLFCRLEIGIQKSRLEEVLYKLGDLRGVEIEKKS